MGEKHADVLIHLDENLDENEVAKLEKVLNDHDGVLEARHREGYTHVLQVRYDPEKTHASDLLEPVTAQGVHAQLIGM